jgi:hypothetical protein
VELTTHSHLVPICRQSFSYPLTGSVPALGISAKVARGVIKDWTSRKHEKYSQSIYDKKAG